MLQKVKCASIDQAVAQVLFQKDNEMLDKPS